MARLSNNSLSYMGVASETPPNYFRINRAPTNKDYKNFKFGDIWNQKDTSNIWMFTDYEPGNATWTDITSDLTTEITITPGDLTITDGDLYINNGGIQLGLINYPSTLRTLGDGTVYGIVDGVDGEILIGATGSTPSWNSITSTGATVTITNSPNGINLEAAGGLAANSYTTDDGNAVVPTAGGNVDLQGGANINTTGAVANQVVFNLDDNITLASVTATANIDIGGTLDVTGVSTLRDDLSVLGDLYLNTTEGVLISSGAGIISSSPGIAGQILTSNGAAVPTWEDNNDSSLSINTQGGNYTIVLGDAGDEIQMTSAVAATLTIPTDAVTNFPIGTELLIVQYGAGTITVAGSVGVALNSVLGRVDTYEQYSAASLIKQAVNSWLLVGDLK